MFSIVPYGCAVLSHFSRIWLFATPRTVARQAPRPWDSPGKNTGVGCHALLQGILSIKELNPFLFCLLHWQVGSLPLAPPGKPMPYGADIQLLVDIFLFLSRLWKTKFPKPPAGTHLWGPSELKYLNKGSQQKITESWIRNPDLEPYKWV